MNTLVDIKTVGHFVTSVRSFFSATTKIEPEIGAPYLFDKMNYASYTGVIGISGCQRGEVYLNIDEDLLEDIMTTTYPELSAYDEELKVSLRKDLCGEISNIISGNVRSFLGENFLISIPVVISHHNQNMELNNAEKAIVFPITWQEKKCHLILNLEKTEGEEFSSEVFDELEFINAD